MDRSPLSSESTGKNFDWLFAKIKDKVFAKYQEKYRNSRDAFPDCDPDTADVEP